MDLGLTFSRWTTSSAWSRVFSCRLYTVSPSTQRCLEFAYLNRFVCTIPVFHGDQSWTSKSAPLHLSQWCWEWIIGFFRPKVFWHVSSEVIFADSHGKVTSFSLDKCIPNGNFAGPTGSVLSLDVHRPIGGNGILACVGLDRFLRLFDISTRASIGKIYCKTKMTSVLIIEGTLGTPGPSASPTKRKKVKEGSTRRADDDESDSVWAKLPEIANVESSSVKRRRVHV